MKGRTFGAVTLIAGSLLAGTVQAQENKAEECAVQAAMVMAVVESRRSGAAPQDAVRDVQQGLEGDQAKYASVVPAVADWVYTLPEDQLGPDVGDSWTEACLAR
ncbi:hypothetical protein ROJ8625_03974 [Roseivivax jejudonensis]|uniref:Uncharacterized protein n=1 Tax=Roseivivax jejudonensis TaxID=1529041 RepID=A0A1X7AA01_9RHOB|nr:hypothetical protein [Roseivivax jejudonensis]SLN73730.1 hypothetical protein ROJ8625_03974 [Roseivivax jejudonensis]